MKRAISYYSLSACEELISRYVDKGGDVITLHEGGVGMGTILCMAEGCKTSLIEEVYLNEWSSTHRIRMFSKTPKKYLAMLA